MGLTAKQRYFVVAALRWLPVGLLAPLQVLFMQERGLTLAQIGIVMACYSATALLLELPTGGLADAVGRRPTLVVSATLAVGGLALMLVAHSFAGFAFAWVLMGMNRALESGALESWYVDEELRRDPDSQIRGGLAGGGATIALAIATGSLVGGWLPRVAPGVWSEAYEPLALPVFAAMLVDVVRLAATLFLIREDRSLDPGSLREGVRDVPSLVRGAVGMARRRRVVGSLVVTVIAGGFALSALENLWQPRFADLIGGVQGRTAFFGVLSASVFLVGALGSMGAPAFARLFGGRLARAAASLQMGMGVVVAGLALAGTVPVAAAGFGGFYVLVGVLDPLHRELLHSQVGSAQRSSLLSLDSFALQVGAIASSLVLPALAQARGIPVAWGAAAAVLTVGGAFYLRAERALDAREPALQDV